MTISFVEGAVHVASRPTVKVSVYTSQWLKSNKHYPNICVTLSITTNINTVECIDMDLAVTAPTVRNGVELRVTSGAGNNNNTCSLCFRVSSYFCNTGCDRSPKLRGEVGSMELLMYLI